MKALAITFRGCEDITALEAREILKKDSTNHETCVEFDAELTDIARFCYLSRSVKRTILLLSKIRFKGIDDIVKAAEDIDFMPFIKDNTFKVVCERIGEHDFSSQDVAAEAGAVIHEKCGAAVKMDAPDIMVFIYICENEAYFGIDMTGFDASKRDYKIFSPGNTLNGAVAYCLVRKGIGKKGILIDPFCSAGTIAIESALYSSNVSVNFHRKDDFSFHRLVRIDLAKLDSDKKDGAFKVYAIDSLMRNIEASKKNAKVAGAVKFVNFSRQDLDWLDTKFDEGEIDYIITNPPEPSRIVDEKTIEKIYKEFFYQVKFILSNKGKMAVILQKDQLFREAIDGFKIVSETEVWQGRLPLSVLVLEKE